MGINSTWEVMPTYIEYTLDMSMCIHRMHMGKEAHGNSMSVVYQKII